MHVIAQDDEESGLFWHNLSVSTGNHTILHTFSGSVKSGHACGVIGPSGSGKSTFLSALGGTSQLRVSGFIRQKKQGLEEGIHSSHVAYLKQQDAFFYMLTPRETLEQAAYLEFPQLPRSHRKDLVDKSLNSLGLGKVADRPIGDRSLKTKGLLSGGERRRLSVGLELLSTPHIFLADECTTGLDSNQAIKTVQLILRLAREQKIPAILTLHQPRASIWKLLDSFLLLAPGGRVCYHGPRNDALKYFEKLGFKCPSETNPAEFYIDLVSVDTEDPQQAKEDEERIDFLFRSFQKEQLKSNNTPSPMNNSQRYGKNLSFRPFQIVRRIGSLFLRSWRQNIRNTNYNVIRFIASVGNAVLFSQIFQSVRKGEPVAGSVADRVALLSYGVINMSMMALMKTIHLFSRERPVVSREQMHQQYTSLEYILSKAIAEIPLDTVFAAVFTTVLKATTGVRVTWSQLTALFSAMTVAGASLGFAIGACAKDADSAMATGLPIIVLFMVVGVINPSGINRAAPPPRIVRWIKLLSPLKWAIEGLCVAEYTGLDLRPKNHRPWQRIAGLPKFGAMALVSNGEQILEALGLENSTYEDVMKHLALLSCLNLFISWVGLRSRDSFGGKTSDPPKSGGAERSNHVQSAMTPSSVDSVRVPIMRKL